MLKIFFLFIFIWTLNSPLAYAQKAPPKSTTMKILNHPDYDASMYESGPVGAVVTSVIVGCAAVEDAINYSCYYGKKWFGSDKQTPAATTGRGNSGNFGKGNLPAWAIPKETPTAFTDIRDNRRRTAQAVSPTAQRAQGSGSAEVEAASSAECEWDMSRPPRIIKAPGCSTTGKCLCQGRVICGNKSRIAVCSENFCKENAATACAKQLRYSSKVVN